MAAGPAADPAQAHPGRTAGGQPGGHRGEQGQRRIGSVRGQPGLKPLGGQRGHGGQRRPRPARPRQAGSCRLRSPVLSSAASTSPRRRPRPGPAGRARGTRSGPGRRATVWLNGWELSTSVARITAATTNSPARAEPRRRTGRPAPWRPARPSPRPGPAARPAPAELGGAERGGHEPAPVARGLRRQRDGQAGQGEHPGHHVRPGLPHAEPDGQAGTDRGEHGPGQGSGERNRHCSLWCTTGGHDADQIDDQPGRCRPAL